MPRMNLVVTSAASQRLLSHSSTIAGWPLNILAASPKTFAKLFVQVCRILIPFVSPADLPPADGFKNEIICNFSSTTQTTGCPMLQREISYKAIIWKKRFSDKINLNLGLESCFQRVQAFNILCSSEVGGREDAGFSPGGRARAMFLYEPFKTPVLAL